MSLNIILNRQMNHNLRIILISYIMTSEDHNSILRKEIHQYYLISKKWYELLLRIEKPKSMNEWCYWNWYIRNKIIVDINGNVNIRDSMITRSMKIIIKEMRDIE